MAWWISEGDRIGIAGAIVAVGRVVEYSTTWLGRKNRVTADSPGHALDDQKHVIEQDECYKSYHFAVKNVYFVSVYVGN